MSEPRRFGLRTLLTVACTAVVGLGAFVLVRHQQARHPVRVAAEFSAGARFADSLEQVLRSAPEKEIGEGDAVAALYFERLRLGLGSPFRLIDYALRDPLLPSSQKRVVAQAILARTQEGRAYETAEGALDLVAMRPGSQMGGAHRQFMEQVTDSAESPRVAELALRLAYTIGSTSGVVSHRASAVAIGAIAQARDRALARRDVNALLAEARRQRMDPVDLVPLWRVTHRFTVEQPLRDPPTPKDESGAAELLPRLLARLDSLAPVPATADVSSGRAAARVAARAVARRAAPPQAPVTVTLTGYSSFVVSGARSPDARSARAAFVARSRNEETMAAELWALRATHGVAPEASLAAVTAAVALRAYAQERPWLPGDDGPSVLELQNRLGLAALTFDSDVPGAWRPYFTRMLDVTVADLKTVFPTLDLAGLHVHFGNSPLKDRALALHDPGSRTIYFPLATGAGAMAHELAHDLDWQAARRRYGIRGGYGTDRSVRQYRDGLAATVRRLASAGRSRSDSAGVETPGERPTEAFARGVDWFVASALGHRGRMNGYLSAVQDEMLTGYASATAPLSGSIEGDATLDALRAITNIDPALLEWYDESYGISRNVSVAAAVRRVLMAPLGRLDVRGPTATFDAFAASSRMLRDSPEASAGWTCLLESPAMRGREGSGVREAMRVAAEARARGLVQRWGDYARGVPDAAWRFRALGGAPWDLTVTDSTVREVRDAILWRAARADDGRPGQDFLERTERHAAWDACARR